MNGEFADVEGYLSVGCPVVVDSDPTRDSGPRYNSTVRGWVGPAYILIDRPMVQGRLAALRENQPCVIRFVREGRACAFAAVVLDWDNRPHHSYCRISWPESLKAVSFRKFERVPVDVPCELTIDDETAAGQLVDISIGGCKVCIEADLSVDAEPLLSATLPSGHAIDHVRCIVRNTREAPGGKSYVGCEFVPGQVTVESDVALFIATSLGRGQQDASDTPSVLIIDQNPKRALLLRHLFESRGSRVILVTGTIDGVCSLRFSNTQAVMVNQTQDDLAGVQTVQLIKRTRGLESLPVFLYGGEAEDLAAEAEQAGATQYFPPGTNAPQIASLVTEHLAALHNNDA